MIFGDISSRFQSKTTVITRLVVGGAFVASLMMPISIAAQTPANDATIPDLASLKSQMILNITDMKEGTAEVLAFAQWYYDQAKAVNFDYQTLWDQQHDEIMSRLTAARAAWVNKAHANYELSEGLVAGVPSLSSFDVLIDAGPSGVDDPTNALDNTLVLPDGTKIQKPGNYFHQVTEPTLWGTNDAYVGLAIDMDGDGKIEVGEALPNANVLIAGSTALDNATADLASAINDWEPTLSDAFTALVNMIPTMEGYFNEWKLSSFVMGAQSEEQGFVANSRLVDVLGILSGLNLTYSKLQSLVDSVDPAMATQIEIGMTDMMNFVQDLLDKENNGTRFTPEEADLYGKSLQDQASTTAGLVTQAAALLEIPLESE